MGSLSQMMGGGGSGQTAQGGTGGLGDVIGSLGNNKAALSALARALPGGWYKFAKGTVGGGGLAKKYYGK